MPILSKHCGLLTDNTELKITIIKYYVQTEKTHDMTLIVGSLTWLNTNKI